ncbi:hypothetical protein AT15_01225 [Kosmotoga arenicorallina S304]|uniref:histidine kinase n=1 Tax=Kosmotoga arenicorallina S304 TaxID=1453497 RepID=A0A176K049_9BACT|nr:HAMP domain-containing sensor histidine kinase [Kosmotoga arenicorallina]OAA29927.1 hypothetical protein AT15_01225 [Kosmotoga arenicorallina S304]
MLSVKRKINLLYLATYVPLILALIFLLVFYVYRWKKSEIDAGIIAFYNDLYRIYTQRIPANAFFSLPGSDKMAFEIYKNGKLVSSFHLSPGAFSELQKKPEGFEDTGEYRVYISSSKIESDTVTFIIAQNVSSESRFFKFFFTFLYTGTGAVIFLIWFFGERITGKLLDPVGKIGKTLQEISKKGILDKRIDVKKTGIEISELEKAVNISLDKIEELISEIETISLNIAHELRTPLAVAKSSLEVALLKAKEPSDFKKSIADSIEELNRVIELSNALLYISKLERGKHTLEKIDLSDLVAKVAEKYMTIYKELDFQLDFEPMVTLSGNEMLLESAISCLIDNACKNTTSKTVKIELKCSGSNIEVLVFNPGKPIPEELRGQIFSKFATADKQNPGIGLGLYISSKIVRLHNGLIRYDHQDGNNVFSIILPMTL